MTFLRQNKHEGLFFIISFICRLQTLGLVFAVIRLTDRFLSLFLLLDFLTIQLLF